MNIPLRNRKKEVVAYTIVSPEHFEHINQYKWHKSGNYVKGKVNNKDWYLHRYIKLQIMKETIPNGYHVDHINNDPLNNHYTNLRITTISENNYNKKKKENCSSQYIGVSKQKNRKWFESQISINNKTLRALYENEIHAAHQYNLWIDEYNVITATKNVIEIPTDFVQHISSISLKELPTGINQLKNGKFSVRITINKQRKWLGKFDTLEKAIEIKENAERKKIELLKEELLKIPKTFNSENKCLFNIGDTEVIIDEDLFHDIIKYSWYISNGYVCGTIKSKQISLSRYIMNYSGELYVDHINNNPLDNRKINLQLATPLQNSYNKKSAKGSTSQYVGVYFHKKNRNWVSKIQVKGVKIHIGTFTDEVKAAKARDIATLKYFGKRGNFNFPIEE